MKSRSIIILVMLTFLLSACQLSLASDITPPPNYQSPTPGPTMSPLFPQNPPNLASGAAIFADKCAPCHGDKGLGDGKMASQLQKAPSAIGKPELGRAAAPANWYTTVTQGNINSFMPPFNGSLSDQQRWDVVAYAISLGGNTPAETEKGKAIFESNCSKCHGPTGNAVPSADFTDQTMMAKLNQTDIANFINKGVGKMTGFGGLIPDADIFAVASYVRSFSETSVDLAAAPSSTSQAANATPTPGGTPEAVATLPGTPGTPGATSTPTPMMGSIGGKIVNGSGGTLPAELKAILHVFEHDTTTQQFSEVSTQVAPVGNDGSYKFDQVPLPANRAFFVSADYANNEYQSNPVFPTPGVSNIDLPLSVYDTTTDTSGLVADQVHVLLDYSKADVVQVVEFLIITNPGKQSVAATQKGGAVVKVVLPKGYTNLQFDQGAIGDRYLKTDDGFADTMPVIPGDKKYQLVFAVDLPLPKPDLFGGTKLEFSQPFPVKINSLSVLVPDGVTISGSNFTPQGLQDNGNGAKYNVFSTTAVEPGKAVLITASGLPGAAPVSTSAGSGQNTIIGVGALGLVLIVVGVWMFLRSRKDASAADEEDDDEEDGSADEIMDAIMTLDDQFKAGNLKEDAYKERRAELKAKLKRNL